MPSTPVPVEKRLEEWVRQQGYPLELAVANQFRQGEFSVVQGTYYEDPQEKIAREIDVVATRYSTTSACDLQFTAVLECKSSSEKPWVVFTSLTRKNERAAVRLRAASLAGKTYLTKGALDQDVRALELFQLRARVGYGVTQAFTGGKDVAYAALMGAAKAAADQLRDYTDNWDAYEPLALIVFPVVVTDARLFECFIDESGELRLEEASRLTVSWQHPGVGKPLLLIDIVRSDAVPSYVGIMKEALALLSSKDKAAAAAQKAWERKYATEESSAAPNGG